MIRGFLIASVVIAPMVALASPFETFEGAAPRRQERAPVVALKDASGVAVRVPSGRPAVLVFGSFS
jgi:hypothetical protein